MTVSTLDGVQPPKQRKQFPPVANIRQNFKADKVSPFRWPPFKRNYSSESWVTAAGVLECESKSTLETVCDGVCAPVFIRAAFDHFLFSSPGDHADVIVTLSFKYFTYRAN